MKARSGGGVFTGTPEYGGDGFVYASERPGLGLISMREAAAKYPPAWTFPHGRMTPTRTVRCRHHKTNHEEK